MARPVKIVLGVLIGFVAWFAVATLGNLLIRALIPGYEAAEPAMSFTLSMQLARLVLGAASSIVAGLACALMTRADLGAVKAFAAVLLLFFLAVHVSLWNEFPWWYHALFLLSLLPLTFVGAALAPHKAPRISTR
jgi:hypothetical protein